ncbi:MAG: GntR family transcriptional regulator [Candidatus Hydrogenedentes bacterium]|nr:GntR family transcriptional regulator [Candidatus Hydrogenedentota bacterium]
MANKEEAPFSINLDSAIAVYVQIENQIEFAVASGKLKAGDLLPSVREMSNMLDVNPNTVTKAYRDLELLEVVHTRRGVGVTISEKATRICRDRALSSVRSHLKEAVAECIACGLPAADIRKIVSQTIETAPQPYLAAE